MRLKPKEARNIVIDNHNDWSKLEETEEIVDNTRWSIITEAVFLHKPTNKYYLFTWSRGSTECQEERPYEYDKYVEPIEVIEKEVTIKQWTAI